MILSGVIASSGGVASSFESIATTTVGSGGSSGITFSSIPQTFSHLQLRWIASPNTATTQDLLLRFNGDTAANYTKHLLYGQGASATIYTQLSQTSLYIDQAAGSTNLSGSFVAGILDILDYTSTSKNKTLRALIGFDTNAASANVAYGAIEFLSGFWFKTPEAITSISLTVSSGLVKEFSSFALYGVKA